MAWRLPGDKPLSEPMLTQFTDADMWHYELSNTGNADSLATHAATASEAALLIKMGYE